MLEQIVMILLVSLVVILLAIASFYIGCRMSTKLGGLNCSGYMLGLHGQL